MHESGLLQVFLPDKGHHQPVSTSPPCTARAVHVFGMIGGRVEVHHEGDRVDVDSAGRDVGRDEGVELASLERVARARWPWLRSP